MVVYSTLALLGLTFLASPILARALGRQAGWPLAAAYLAAAALLLPTAAAVAAGQTPTWGFDWIPMLAIRATFTIDGLGLLFANLALLIGAVVLVYSTRYLGSGPSTSFFVGMTGFTFAMVALVFSGDLVVTFICWELTSLASFFLIARSGEPGEGPAMRTLLLTFVGGIALLTATVAIWWRIGSTDIATVFSSELWTTEPAFATTIAILVALAGFSKAAQFPFHIWLPDAMAAITPVSAYLHAAAVVKAGIFLLLRFSPVLHGVPTWNLLLLVVGLGTMCLGGYFALEHTDIKKLLAYSTVSQLGLITASIGLGTQAGITAAVCHTVAHALFKSGLFMMVGVIDHATGTRQLGCFPPRLYRRLPVSFAVTVLGCASMAGIPLTLGFVSKEAILAALLGAPHASWVGWAAFVTAVIASIITFTYCARLVLGVFVDGGEPQRQVTLRDPLLVASAAAPILTALVLVIWLPAMDDPVSWGATAAFGSPVAAHISMWHGLTVELAATAVIIVVGSGLALSRATVIATINRHPFPLSGPRILRMIEHKIGALGARLDRLTASDTVTRNILPILAMLGIIGVSGAWLVFRHGLPEQRSGLTHPLDVLLFILITAAVIGACISTLRIAAVLSLSAVGILATVQILTLGAPDVAMTQLLVETLNIIVIMLVLQRLPRTFPKRRLKGSLLTLGIAVMVGAGVAALTWALVARRDKSELAGYFLEQTLTIASGENVVNVILVEFRAFDTLGELSVLAMAAVAILALLSTVLDKHLDPPSNDPYLVPLSAMPINPDPNSRAYRAVMEAGPNAVGLRVMLRYMTPLLVVISILLFWRGHNSPGGGFNAALVMASLMGLVYLSTVKDRQIGPPRLPLFFIGGGVVLAVLTGCLGLIFADSFLEPIHGEYFGIHLTTSMIFDAGVYLAVVGLILVSINVLGTTRGTAEGGEGARERIDEALEGELPGPLDSVRGERATEVRR